MLAASPVFGTLVVASNANTMNLAATFLNILGRLSVHTASDVLAVEIGVEHAARRRGRVEDVLILQGREYLPRIRGHGLQLRVRQVTRGPRPEAENVTLERERGRSFVPQDVG